MLVDHEGVRVEICTGSLQVRVIFAELRMLVFDHVRIIRRPKRYGRGGPKSSHRCENKRSDRQSGRPAEPTRDRVGEKPAGM